MSAERERRDELAVGLLLWALARSGTRSTLCAMLLMTVAGCGEADDGLPCHPNIRPQLEYIAMDDGHTGEFAAGRYYLEIESAHAREIEVTARYLGTEAPP